MIDFGIEEGVGIFGVNSPVGRQYNLKPQIHGNTL